MFHRPLSRVPKNIQCREGHSRCFGFVGFKTPEEAAAALKYFNKSVLDTSRLEVSLAESFKTIDKQVHRPWSKYSEGSSAYADVSQRPLEKGVVTEQRKRKRDESKVRRTTTTTFMRSPRKWPLGWRMVSRCLERSCAIEIATVASGTTSSRQ
jgi:RNA recognition motif-containing protein